MSFAGPNLAREPFVNLRPVQRAAIALWIAVVALGVWNVAAYLRSGAGAAEKAAELERQQSGTAQSRARIATLEADLRRADLVQANLRTDYLNERIAERAFSWNLLFDRLTEVLPRGVRLAQLTPELGRQASATQLQTRSAPAGPRRVQLGISGEAEDGEALLALVDSLFAHTAFDGPNLAREAQTSSGTIDFDLSVAYLPEELGEPVAGSRAAAAQTTDPAPGGAARATATAPAATAAPGETPPTAAGAAARPPAVGGPLGEAAAVTPGAAGGPRAREAAPPPGTRGPAVELAPEEQAVRPGEDEAATRATPTPRPSIFGVPLFVRPTASGGRP